jgi:hypothetical protein
LGVQKITADYVSLIPGRRPEKDPADYVSLLPGRPDKDPTDYVSLLHRDGKFGVQKKTPPITFPWYRDGKFGVQKITADYVPLIPERYIRSPEKDPADYVSLNYRR